MKTIKREIEILSKIDNPYIVKYENKKLLQNVSCSKNFKKLLYIFRIL